MLCGLIGYGVGNRVAQREISQEEAESLIRSFLSQVPLDAVIDYWIEANNCNTVGERIKVENILKNKADHII